MMSAKNQSRRLKKFIGGKIILGLLFVYTFVTFGPLLWVFTMAFKTTNEIRESPYSIPLVPKLTNFINVWTESNYRIYFMNSVIVVGVALAALVLVTTMAAYCFAKLPFKGSDIIFLIIFATIMMPAQILLIPLYQMLVKYGLFNSLFGLILVYIATQMPLGIYILRSFFARIPGTLNEAARIDGCTEWQTFIKIMFPIAMPAISTIIVIKFIHLWNEFLFAVVFIQEEDKRTIPLGVMKFVGEVYEDLGMIAAAVILSIVPVIILYLAFSEKFIQGMAQGAVKG